MKKRVNLRLPGGGERGRRRERPCSHASCVHSEEEAEFIIAVARFKDRNKVLFPTLSQLLWVLKQLGWERKLKI